MLLPRTDRDFRDRDENTVPSFPPSLGFPTYRTPLSSRAWYALLYRPRARCYDAFFLQGCQFTSGLGAKTTAGHAWNREQMFFPVKVRCDCCVVLAEAFFFFASVNPSRAKLQPRFGDKQLVFFIKNFLVPKNWAATSKGLENGCCTKHRIDQIPIFWMISGRDLL